VPHAPNPEASGARRFLVRFRRFVRARLLILSEVEGESCRKRRKPGNALVAGCGDWSGHDFSRAEQAARSTALAAEGQSFDFL
jgi:hypothetical protein